MCDVAGIDTSLSGKRVSFSKGLINEPFSLSVSWPMVGPRVLVGTVASALSRAEGTELLVLARVRWQGVLLAVAGVVHKRPRITFINVYDTIGILSANDCVLYIS